MTIMFYFFRANQRMIASEMASGVGFIILLLAINKGKW